MIRPGMSILVSTTLCVFQLMTAGPGVATEPPPASGEARPGEVEEMLVSGQAPTETPAGTTVIPVQQMQWRNPGSLAEVGSLLPATRVAVNSRGESYLMIRGAPERHVQTFLDGIPLNLAWDERVDLETIPLTGMGRLQSVRGIPSLLAGPGALAGTVRILPPDLTGDRHARLGLSLGSGSRVRADLFDLRHRGDWKVLASGSWQSRSYFPRPHSGRERFNSDLKQVSGLVRASRPLADGGRLNLLATVWGGEKGVPPESHEGEDARFWRYPLRSRVLLGSSMQIPLADHAYELNTMAAVDFFRQEIDGRGPDGWDQPLVNGQKYEKSFDRTVNAAAGLTRWLGNRGRLSLQTNWRYNQHRESARVGSGVQSFAQILGAAVLEGEYLAPRNWRLRAGLGWDQASTPESGDKPSAEVFSAGAWQARLEKEWSPGNTAHVSYARRSRFPSLRELYSGALDEFVPNPDLQPEEQEIFELGWNLERPRWNMFGAVFYQMLHDGIEKQVLPDNPDDPGQSEQFMRVNRTRIRVPGLEWGLDWRPWSSTEIFLRYTLLEARVETETGFDRPAEDRPNYLARGGFIWSRETGPGALLEAEYTGARFSADSTDQETGLRRLYGHILLHTRLSYRWQWDVAGSANPRQLEAFLRVNNLLDETAYFQTGLVEPGRVYVVGASIGY
jgi:iron complex outermembrane receptor protein